METFDFNVIVEEVLSFQVDADSRAEARQRLEDALWKEGHADWRAIDANGVRCVDTTTQFGSTHMLNEDGEWEEI